MSKPRYAVLDTAGHITLLISEHITLASALSDASKYRGVVEDRKTGRIQCRDCGRIACNC